MARIVWEFLFCSLISEWFKFLEKELIWLKNVSSIKKATSKQSLKLSKAKF